MEVNEEILNCILAFMEEYKIPAYDEEKHKGLVRHVLIRYGFTTDEIMVCLIFNGEDDSVRQIWSDVYDKFRE